MRLNTASDTIRLILQGISIVGGLIGVMFFYIGGHFLYSLLVDKVYLVLFMVPLFFLIGGYFIYVAYIMIKRFSSRAIKHFCLMLTLILYGCLNHILNPFIKSSNLEPFNPQYVVYLFLPLILAIIFYKIAKKALPKLTDIEKNS